MQGKKPLNGGKPKRLDYNDIVNAPRANVVSKDEFDKINWKYNLAQTQLESYGTKMGEWRLYFNIYFNRKNSVSVYAVARCSECEEFYHSYTTLRKETFNFDDANDINQEVLNSCVDKLRKKVLNLPSLSLPKYCEHCGAKLNNPCLPKNRKVGECCED